MSSQGTETEPNLVQSYEQQLHERILQRQDLLVCRYKDSPDSFFVLDLANPGDFFPEATYVMGEIVKKQAICSLVEMQIRKQKPKASDKDFQQNATIVHARQDIEVLQGRLKDTLLIIEVNDVDQITGWHYESQNENDYLFFMLITRSREDLDIFLENSKKYEIERVVRDLIDSRILARDTKDREKAQEIRREMGDRYDNYISSMSGPDAKEFEDYMEPFINVVVDWTQRSTLT